MDVFNLEAVYDAEISPLMAQIIEICKKHRMPMLASFCYARRDDEGEDYCTTVLPRGEEQTDAIQRAYAEVMREPTFMAFTVTTERP